MTSKVPALSDLTPSWIGACLLKNGIVADVQTVTPRPIGTGQVGATYRLSITYRTGAADAPATLIAKLPSNDPLSRATGKTHLTYIRESRFYQTFAGKRPMAIPDHLFIAFDDESHDFALIMRDLPDHVTGDQLSFPNPKEAMLAMDAAATIHAAWWGDPLLDTLDWLNGTKSVPPPLDLEALYTMFWPGFCERYGNRVTANIKSVGDAFLGHVGAWSSRSCGPRCLTHNDFRPDNMMFNLNDPSQPIVIVDWQTVGVGCGAADIAYFTGTALDPAVRKSDERALIERYRHSLNASGVAMDDTLTVWDDYRRAAFSGFLMGVTASMVVGQTERGDSMFLAMCERSAQMVLDHSAMALPSR